MSRYNGPPRHRPEPLALGAGPHHHHHQQHPPPLYSAPLPYMSQAAYASIPQQQQQPQHLGPRFQATPQTANALAEFQHAQQAYLAELNRTIEHQILVQQQVEREAAYRMLALQQQQREQYGLHQATTAQPQWQEHQQQQQQQAYANQYGYSVGQQQHVSLSQQQQQATNNPLVASALARRQRQEAAIALEQEQARAQASRRNKTTPSPPAVILSAPGEPYPDTSSSGSDSGETRPTSPESLAHATTAVSAVSAATDEKKPSRGGDEVKAARRRSHLDALTHTVEHAEERMRRRRPVSIAGPADLASAPNHHQQPSHHRYQTEQYRRQLSPRWPSPASQGRHRISSDPLLSSAPLPASSANATFRSHSAASASPSTCSSSSSSATVVPPTPSAPSTRVGAAPPVPGTASAIRQPRGPPTDLDAAQNNFAARIRARAIESLKGARHGRTSATAATAAVQEGGAFDDASSLTTSLVGMRLTTA